MAAISEITEEKYQLALNNKWWWAPLKELTVISWSHITHF